MTPPVPSAACPNRPRSSERRQGQRAARPRLGEQLHGERTRRGGWVGELHLFFCGGAADLMSCGRDGTQRLRSQVSSPVLPLRCKGSLPPTAVGPSIASSGSPALDPSACEAGARRSSTPWMTWKASHTPTLGEMPNVPAPIGGGREASRSAWRPSRILRIGNLKPTAAPTSTAPRSVCINGGVPVSA